MSRPLPQQRQKVMDFIAAELSAGRAFPSAGQITQFMGWRQTGSAKDVLYKLTWYDKVLTRHADGTYHINLNVEAA